MKTLLLYKVINKIIHNSNIEIEWEVKFMEKEMEIGELKTVKLETSKVFTVGYRFRDQKEWYWDVVEHIEANKYKCKLVGKIILVE